jgi:hypothetical protein
MTVHLCVFSHYIFTVIIPGRELDYITLLSVRVRAVRIITWRSSFEKVTSTAPSTVSR